MDPQSAEKKHKRKHKDEGGSDVAKKTKHKEKKHKKEAKEKHHKKHRASAAAAGAAAGEPAAPSRPTVEGTPSKCVCHSSSASMTAMHGSTDRQPRATTQLPSCGWHQHIPLQVLVEVLHSSCMHGGVVHMEGCACAALCDVLWPCKLQRTLYPNAHPVTHTDPLLAPPRGTQAQDSAFPLTRQLAVPDH